jgi:hypothetical protein
MALPIDTHFLEFVGEQQLGTRVPAPDTRHDGTALFGGHDVTAMPTQLGTKGRKFVHFLQRLAYTLVS